MKIKSMSQVNQLSKLAWDCAREHVQQSRALTGQTHSEFPPQFVPHEIQIRVPAHGLESTWDETPNPAVMPVSCPSSLGKVPHKEF
jgi:hypothetical protein